MNVTFFDSQSHFRAWLQENHNITTEVWIGFFKKDSGKKGLTYREALDEALCFGWIDGIRKGLDAISYINRFTPRKPRSNWSLINTRRVRELIAQGRVAPAGLAAFNARDPNRTGVYCFENASRQ